MTGQTSDKEGEQREQDHRRVLAAERILRCGNQSELKILLCTFLVMLQLGELRLSSMTTSHRTSEGIRQMFPHKNMGGRTCSPHDLYVCYEGSRGFLGTLPWQL